MLLAVGGSLVAAEPAHAAVPAADNIMTPLFWNIAHFGAPSWEVGEDVSAKNNTWSNTPTSMSHDWYLCVASNSVVTSGDCTSITPNVTVTGAGSNGYSTYTLLSGDVGKYAVVKMTATNADGSGTTTIRASNPITAIPVVTLNANGGTLGTTTAITGRSVTLPGIMTQSATRPTRTGCSLSGWSSSTSAANMVQDSYLANADITLYAIWAGANCSSVSLTPSAPTTSTVVAESAKPLPVWAAPILKAIPTLSKTLTTAGGKIGLTDGDFSSLKSVTIGGAAVAFSIDAKGDVNIPVPAGKGGTTADLIVTFTGGKMTIQEGIKYVEPVNVAAVREAPIAGFKGKSTKITGALAESIQYAAQLDKKATTVLCTGYAASKAVLALAAARAKAACAYATKANDLLVNKTVKVVVNAKLAKTAAVGIKVHK